jgi:hypothetical protein
VIAEYHPEKSKTVCHLWFLVRFKGSMPYIIALPGILAGAHFWIIRARAAAPMPQGT